MSLKSDIEELYNINVLVMVETGPQSDEYMQIALTKKQHRRLMRLLNQFTTPVEDGFIVPVTDDDEVVIPNRNQYCMDSCMDTK